MYTGQCNKKCTGHCLHVTILNSHRSVVTVPVPSFNGSHEGSFGQQIVNKKWDFPSGSTPSHFKYDTWASVVPKASRNISPNAVSATTRHLQGYNRSHTCCLNISQSAIGEHHLIASASLTSPTYTINITKSWSPTTAYKHPAIIRITTHVRGYLIKHDRSSVVY